MKLAYYIKKDTLQSDKRVDDLLSRINKAGIQTYPVRREEDVQTGTQALLAIGGDGTFLSSAQMAVSSDLAILGINFGRLGFLSGINPEDLPDALINGELVQDNRTLLQVRTSSPLPENFWPYALNEMSISRSSASMLGIQVRLNGSSLTTYWADGLIIATSSGSTAYSMSVGGPICTPDTEVLIIAPVSPHNLNLRPLVVPKTAEIEIRLHSRVDNLSFSADNRSCKLSSDTVFTITASEQQLKRLSSGKSDFVNALRTRLLWGEDLRNTPDNQAVYTKI